MVNVSQISPGSSSKVYLKCPLTKTGICMEDCLGVNQQLQYYITECTSEKTADDNLMLVYTVKLDHLNVSADWTCTYRGLEASAIHLRAAERKMKSTTTSTTTLAPTTTSERPVVIAASPEGEKAVKM
ncbi:hypothetical protein Ciccas_010448 [Cichlidogyrus casuarinus]|uniref:Uncharacterized protein n=1 Tax=Cichlidogyrus casuarinus TaxID=1844966 RepID=A0ABD2PW41_9PLAT